MKTRLRISLLQGTPLSSFVALATVAALFTGCGNSPESRGTGSAGASAGGGSAGAPTSGGSGGLGSGGLSASGGLSSAGGGGSGGVGAGGSGGQIATGGGGNAGSSAAGSGGGSAIPATFDTVKLVVEGGGGVQSCGAAPCHGVGGMAPPGSPLTLANNEQLYTHLTAYTSKACGNIALVKAGDPEGSALIKILKGPCGSTPRMPYQCVASAGSCIPDEYIAAVAQWIANGAQK